MSKKTINVNDVTSMKDYEFFKKKTGIERPKEVGDHGTTDKKMVRCDLCNKSYTGRKGYLQHLRNKVHKALESQQTTAPTKQDRSDKQNLPTAPDIQQTNKEETEFIKHMTKGMSVDEVKAVMDEFWKEKEQMMRQAKEERQKIKNDVKLKKQSEKETRRKVKMQAYTEYQKLLNNPDVIRLVKGLSTPQTKQVKQESKQETGDKTEEELNEKPKQMLTVKKDVQESGIQSYKKRYITPQYTAGQTNPYTGLKVTLRTRINKDGTLTQYYE